MAASALDEIFRRHEGDDALRWLDAESTPHSPHGAQPQSTTATTWIAYCAHWFERAHLSAWSSK